MKDSDIVYFMEKNIHGAWVVYGINNVKQYYGYSKKEARRRYIEEARQEIITNKE